MGGLGAHDADAKGLIGLDHDLPTMHLWLWCVSEWSPPCHTLITSFQFLFFTA